MKLTVRTKTTPRFRGRFVPREGLITLELQRDGSGWTVREHMHMVQARVAMMDDPE